MFEANELKNKNLDYMLRIFLFCIFIRRQLSKSLQQCRTNVGIFMGNHFFFHFRLPSLDFGDGLQTPSCQPPSDPK